MEDYRDILTFKAGKHAVVQLNRPEKMNALSHNPRAEMLDALERFELDPDVRVIVLRGSGRAWSAGYDLSGIAETEDERHYVDPRSGLPNVGSIHPGQGQRPQHLLSGLAAGGDIQELGRTRPGGGEFGLVAREKGLKAALDWRDGPFADYGSAPPGSGRPAAAPW